MEILKGVDWIACEDTRRTGILLKHVGVVSAKTFPYHLGNEEKETEKVVEKLLSGDRGALVSDAGTPAISDPGFLLVRTCREKEIPVFSIPGPSAITSALSVSGLPPQPFTFLGFPPAKGRQRQKFVEESVAIPHSVVFFEAPHRLKSLLETLKELVPHRLLAVVRELTKIHESVLVGTPGDLLERVLPRGEIVVILGPWEAPITPPKKKEMQDAYQQMREEGLTAGQALAILAHRYRMPRREVYSLVHSSPDTSSGQS